MISADDTLLAGVVLLAIGLGGGWAARAFGRKGGVLRRTKWSYVLALLLGSAIVLLVLSLIERALNGPQPMY